MPSHGLRGVISQAAPHLPAGAVLVSATKGLKRKRSAGCRKSFCEETGARHPVVVLSGPSFAVEVARQLPTAILAASQDAAAIELVQQEFRGPYFRLYGSADVVGVEIGAALKNIIAIAAGRRRVAGAGAQRAGGAHHARPGGDLAAGVRRRRSARKRSRA